MFADVLVEEDSRTQKIKPMPFDQTLQPDTMYQEIVDVIKEERKKLHLFKKNLTTQNLKLSLSRNPKILFIVCHGGESKHGQSSHSQTYFCFEGDDIPSKLDRFDEKRLRDLLMVGKGKEH